MTGLITHGRPTASAAASASFAALGELVTRRDQAKLAGGEFADAVAVHRQLHRLGRRRNAPALALQARRAWRCRSPRFPGRSRRAVLLDRGPKRRAVEHREDFERVRALHGGRLRIAVAGDHPAAEPLGGNGEFAAELSRAEQHQCGKVHRPGDSGAPDPPLDRVQSRRTPSDAVDADTSTCRADRRCAAGQADHAFRARRGSARSCVAHDQPGRAAGDRPQSRRARGRAARSCVRAGPCREHPGAGPRALVGRGRGLSRAGQLRRAMGQ